MGSKFAVLKNVEALQDQTVAVGGDYTPPAEGLANLRFVAYVEVGKHRKVFKGAESFKPMVHLVFELSGKKWEPKKLDSGEYVPQRITVKLPLSTTTKSHYYKLFLKMRNDRPEITHMAQMLTEAFRGEIVHREYTVNEGGKEVKKIAAEFVKDKEFTITQAIRKEEVLDDDGEPTGEVREIPIKVAEPLSDERCFIWDHADKEQWDSLYIEGETDGRTRNVFQELICKAQNFSGSLAEALATGSVALDNVLKGKSKHQEDAGEGADGGEESESKADEKAAKASKALKDKKATQGDAAEDNKNLLDGVE